MTIAEKHSKFLQNPDFLLSCFHSLSLPDDGLFSVRSPVPEGAIPPAGKRFPLLHPVSWVIETSYHPEAFSLPG